VVVQVIAAKVMNLMLRKPIKFRINKKLDGHKKDMPEIACLSIEILNLQTKLLILTS
jgi:hypothetical protein